MDHEQLQGMKQLSYLKLGHHRGTRRLWIEGGRLEEAGFAPGTRFRLEHDPTRQALHIRIDELGERRTSRKRKGHREVPVLDINNEGLREVFGDHVDRVRAIITRETIIISVHPDDAAAAERYGRLVARLQGREPLAIGSVSHGGGVMDNALHEGLRRAEVPVRLAFAIEIEHRYLEASLRNNSIWDAESIAVHAPMEEVEGGLLPKVDLFVGGIPCTGASLAGRAKNKNASAEAHESAGHLFYAFLELLKHGNPAVVVLENVVPYRNTTSMSVIRAVLEKRGYEIHEAVLEGNAMGALEDRKRFVMVAVTRGLPFDFSAIRPIRGKEQTLGEILEALPLDDERWRNYAYLDRKAQRDKSWKEMGRGSGFPQQILGPEAETVGTIGRQYWKGRSTEPFIRHPTDPQLKRLLTPAEHARVKGIPESLVQGEASTTGHEILGQSVIHPAFVALGALIGRSLRQSAGQVVEHTTGTDATAKEMEALHQWTLDL